MMDLYDNKQLHTICWGSYCYYQWSKVVWVMQAKRKWLSNWTSLSQLITLGGGGGISQVSIIFLWKCLFLFWAQKIWNWDNYILIYFFIVLKSGDRSAFLLAPLYIYLEQTLKHGSTCSFLLASKLIFQFQVGERVRGRIAACGGELLWSSERGRSGAGRASQQ